MASLKPPFSLQTAHQKVKAAQTLGNTCDATAVTKAYTPNSIWRNRHHCLRGHSEIQAFLTSKWQREKESRLRKELFAFSEQGGRNRIAIQFWYEYRDAQNHLKWKRCYGIEHWTFVAKGKMEKRMMSGNDVEIGEDGRWFKLGVNIDGILQERVIHIISEPRLGCSYINLNSNHSNKPSQFTGSYRYNLYFK